MSTTRRGFFATVAAAFVAPKVKLPEPWSVSVTTGPSYLTRTMISNEMLEVLRSRMVISRECVLKCWVIFSL